ncbi:AAA family ATPase [Rothia nasimurium]|uniref:AAA family ATPase n=1 Tax=Rothia nasimurium TaxID=85336 RepID=UPI001F01CD9E|nr:AAA family ATPase [Rothia nasimurium]
MTIFAIYRPESTRDPKLGIKSSFPKPHEGISTLILLYLSNKNRKFKPFSAQRGDLEIKPHFIETAKEYLSQNSNLNQDQIEVFGEYISSNALSSVQIEAQIVLFEVMLGIASVKFYDHISVSSERTGRKRYPKEYTFTSLIDILADEAEYNKDYCSLLACWASGQESSNQYTAASKKFSKKLLYLLCKTQFKSSDAIQGDIYFNTIGLYKKILEDGGFTLGNLEKKGPLRILNSIISYNLLPGLYRENSQFKLSYSEDSDRGFTQEEIIELITSATDYIDLSNVAELVTSDNTEQRFISNQQEDAVAPIDEEILDDYRNQNLYEFTGPHNLILYGVPGSGKSYEIDNNLLDPSVQATRVVFHPDYLYSHFIGQILPSVNDQGDVTYSFKPGPFARILKESITSPSVKHALIIEEINRGNAASIFGDIFQLLDRDDRGDSRYCIVNTELSNYVFGNSDIKIFIPKNLYIYATMNTSDQNVFTLDTAFQRRWTMKMVLNEIETVSYADSKILDTSTSWGQFNTVINSLIMNSSDGITSMEDKRLGAYFVSESEIRNSDQNMSLFAEKVIKYLWDDAFKYDRSILFKFSDSRSLEEVLKSFSRSEGDNRWQDVFNQNVVEKLLDPFVTNE